MTLNKKIHTALWNREPWGIDRYMCGDDAHLARLGQKLHSGQIQVGKSGQNRVPTGSQRQHFCGANAYQSRSVIANAGSEMP